MKLVCLLALVVLAGCAKPPECHEPDVKTTVVDLIKSAVNKEGREFKTQYPALLKSYVETSLPAGLEIGIKDVKQKSLANKQEGYACTANVELVLPRANVVRDISEGREFDLMANLLFGYVELPAESADAIDALEQISKIFGIEVYRNYANRSEETKKIAIEDRVPMVFAATALVLPVAGEVRNELEFLDKLVEESGIDAGFADRINLEISYISEMKKIDGKVRPYVEIEDASEPVRRVITYSMLNHIYERGEQGLGRIKKYEDDFNRMVAGQWVGTYKCDGLEGAAEGARGPYEQNVSAQIMRDSKKYSSYSFALDRVTLSGGVEKLKGSFESSAAKRWGVAGIGRNSADDFWYTEFQMGFDSGKLNGDGLIKSESGEIYRACSINLSKS